jgi:hypothetical protein
MRRAPADALREGACGKPGRLTAAGGLPARMTSDSARGPSMLALLCAARAAAFWRRAADSAFTCSPAPRGGNFRRRDTLCTGNGARAMTCPERGELCFVSSCSCCLSSGPPPLRPCLGPTRAADGTQTARCPSGRSRSNYGSALRGYTSNASNSPFANLRAIHVDPERFIKCTARPMRTLRA